MRTYLLETKCTIGQRPLTIALECKMQSARQARKLADQQHANALILPERKGKVETKLYCLVSYRSGG